MSRAQTLLVLNMQSIVSFQIHKSIFQGGLKDPFDIINKGKFF